MQHLPAATSNSTLNQQLSLRHADDIAADSKFTSTSYTGCNDMFAADCPVVGHENLATGSTLARDCSLRLDFLLYVVASLLRLDVQVTCWYLETAGLKPSADYDDVIDDFINAKPSAESLARRRFISFTSLLIC
ncbi:hypothetical protein F511_41016 [Dorcoceras hygrometricum]|uniref:Uncharacterized protein n=1 Tax=Dorcoceras hygrometricum TaxID=472368 RepID=A0A2Z7AGZ7_9LAMI|nr:hypothetical protein F511_41016 [Dorcoceras hygrometricum]